MATFNANQAETYQASGDISANQYEVMQISNGGTQIAVADTASDGNIVGILQDKPKAAGRNATCAYAGVSKARAGAAISSGNVLLTFNGSGRVILATSGDYVIGRNVETAAADGNIIRVILQPPWLLPI